MRFSNFLSSANFHWAAIFLLGLLSLLAVFFVWKYRAKISRTGFVIIIIAFMIAGAAVRYAQNKNQIPAGSDVQYAGLDKRDTALSSATVADLSQVSLATGDLALGSDNSLMVKHNSISSSDIKDKTIKNVDIASSAINSRTIKNGSIAAKDLNTDGGSGFLQNNNGELTWSPISVALSNLAIPSVGDPTVMDDLGEAFDYMWSAGVISGGDIHDNGDGSVNVASGEAMLRTSASQTAPLKSMVFPGRNNIAMVNDATNYLWVNYHGGDPQVETSTTITDFNCLDKCHLYTVVREDNELTILDGRFQNIDANRKQRRKNYETEPFAHVAGGTALDNNGYNITVSPGAFYYSLTKITQNAFDTSLAGTSPDRVFEYYYRDGSGGWNEVVNSKQLDDRHYDDGSGTLAGDGGNQYVVNWIFMLLGQTPKLGVVYGRSYYSSDNLTGAEEEGIPQDLPPSISGAGVLIGKVIVQAAGDVAEVKSAFTNTFNSGGNTSLSSLTGLGDDALKQYALLAGRAGGQTLSGGNAANDALTISGNSVSGNTLTNANLNFNVGDSGSTQAMTILNNGNVAIGTADPGAYKLYINGGGYLNDSAWTYASDRRLKENISPLTDSLSVISQLNPVQFDYINGGKNQLGFIAQDVQKVLPNLVEKRPDGMLGLRTDELLPVAIRAIQQQQTEIEALQKGNGSSQLPTNSGLVGSATLQKGDTSIEVKAPAIKKDSKIFLTITSKLGTEATLMATKIKEGESFTVELVNPLNQDVDFNWWIVQSQ